MVTSRKRENLEKRIEALGWKMHGSGGRISSWVLRDNSQGADHSLRLLFGNLDEVEKVVDWLESLGLGQQSLTSAESLNAHFLHSIAENAIYALESAGADAELGLLLGYLKRVLTRMKNP